MIPADNINELIKKLKLKASADLDRRVHEDISGALVESRKTESAATRSNIWRIIMKSRITKLAAAVVIIIAFFAGLHFWKSTGSGIALADVLTRIEQVTGYTYQLSTASRPEQASTTERTVLVSREYGIKVTKTKIGPNNLQAKQHRSDAVGDEMYLLPQSNSIVVVSHKNKTYERFIYDGVKLDFYKEQYNDPRAIIRQILSCEHKSLGQSVIDGVTVEGFQTTDIAYGGGFFGEADRKGAAEKVDVKLWVDVNTFLPIRVEEDIVPVERGRIYEVSYDFRWNVVINPDDFKPNIPEDYRAPGEDIIIGPFSEENVIKVLKVLADNLNKYPPSLDLKKGFGRELKRLVSVDPDSYREPSYEEMLFFAEPALFYVKLVEENKAPAYYGETVKPGEADKVLMRWKLSDSEYRVIFGDLSVKTVTAEELAELEKP